MQRADEICIRSLTEDDPPTIAAEFERMGWNKPETRYREYLREQAAGSRTCFVATVGGRFAGYVTVNWRPTYPGFADQNTPEIQDLNVLQNSRRRGVASRLLDRAEAEVASRSTNVGKGVGLHPGYNVAQKLYVKRGYVPDGRGITYDAEWATTPARATASNQRPGNKMHREIELLLVVTALCLIVVVVRRMRSGGDDEET